MRILKKTLHDCLEAEKQELDPEDATFLQEVIGVFNASCDLLLEERGTEKMSVADAQTLLDKQEEFYFKAKTAFFEGLQVLCSSYN